MTTSALPLPTGYRSSHLPKQPANQPTFINQEHCAADSSLFRPLIIALTNPLTTPLDIHISIFLSYFQSSPLCSENQ